MSRHNGNGLTTPTIVKHLSIPVLTSSRINLNYEDCDDSVFLPAPGSPGTTRSKPSTPTELLPIHPSLTASSATVSSVPNGRISPANGCAVHGATIHRGTQTAIRKNSSTVLPPRKLSTSGLLQEPSLSVYVAATEKARESHDSSAMRKISQVGHVFTSTFGWNNHPSHDVIVAQSRTLCGRYIRYKVRALSGISCKKINLQRIRSVTNLSAIFGPASPDVNSNPSLNAVSSHIRRLGMELERTHPKLYHSVTSNVGVQSLTSEASAQNLLHSIAKELFRQEVNWGRVVAFFAISGALAMDCVRLGRPEYVMGLVDGLANVVDRSLAHWIATQGGWEALQGQFRRSRRFQLTKVVFHILIPLSLLLALFWHF